MKSDYPERLRIRLARTLENFNPQGASNTLDEAFASLSIDAALSEVVLPCVQATANGLGSVWAASTIAHAGLVETCLLALASGWDEGGNPTVVIACARDDRYTFGGIALGLALRDRGWRVVYLGSSTRPESAVGAAERADARALVLAAPDPSRVVMLRDPLGRLDPSRHVLIVGDGATLTTARRLHADVLSQNPVLAARQLHCRFGAGDDPRWSPIPRSR
jgi:MerR family transcriptional regulator, light-induced transcriptional regulator